MATQAERVFRKRRNAVVGIIVSVLVVLGVNPGFISDSEPFSTTDTVQTDVLANTTTSERIAIEVLETLEVRERASKAGYSRDEFGSGWATFDEGCDMRNVILARSLSEPKIDEDTCTVLQGTLLDPYTGKTIFFSRGTSSSSAVQIDHVVALSDAWQKGAQAMDFTERVVFANDPLNLLAVDGPANQQKGDSDAASWLPPNKSFRCQYVARQIAIKSAYNLWITAAERSAMLRVLNGCKDQRLPIES